METPPGTQPAAQFITTWTGAYNNGNTVLYFPREIRDMIYEEVVVADASYQQKAEYIRTPSGLGSTNHQIRGECFPMIIQHKRIRLEPLDHDSPPLEPLLPYFPKLLKVLRSVLPNGAGFMNVRSIHLGGLATFLNWPDVSPLLPSTDLCSAASLAQNCPNLRHFGLTFTAKDVRKTGLIRKTVDEFVAHFKLYHFLGFKKLKTIKLEIRAWPSDFRFYLVGRLVDIKAFYGLVDWFTTEYQKRGQHVEVTSGRSVAWRKGIRSYGITRD